MSQPGTTAPLSLARLHELVDTGAVDTVLLAMTDMQGRLQGKRIAARHFLDDVVPHSAEACNYLLAVDVEMNTVGGYQMSSWERGYGDFTLRPDLDTLRMATWHPATALVLADVTWADGSPVAASPRQVLRRQLDRLAERGLVAQVGTELEFIVFDDSYEQAWTNGYRNMTPSNQYNVDYSLLGTSRIEPLLRRIRNEMTAAGLRVESAKGECNPGQHEIAFRYAEALATCDNHSIYKTAAKEIAAQEGKSLTFMAKYNQREGNSCHIHISLRGADGELVFAGDRRHGMSALAEHFLAGQLAHLRALTLLLAPNINSYKRFVPGSFAPTAVAWGPDNRTCALRLVGHGGASLRVENRVPGGDVNPYLATAALIAAGLDGIDRELPLGEALTGNAYASDAEHVPATMPEAVEAFAASELARTAFGEDVVAHYLNAARIEIGAYQAAVTDWELFRGFERL
ncbi:MULTISPECIES: glutamine synthetase family protein [unclassified Crossiella]|uniref:glutamine synthetase family protein n=1 Tax=Crossiella sp. SN42 TaxID=2944808 RepID=UPI00207CA6FA|nr:glutamine synthetase family protein [Crossiella sp. SN42]MCO1576101.1 glutamine synthetase family protein [Crossiella sp. SN42]